MIRLRGLNTGNVTVPADSTKDGELVKILRARPGNEIEQATTWASVLKLKDCRTQNRSDTVTTGQSREAKEALIELIPRLGAGRPPR